MGLMPHFIEAVIAKGVITNKENTIEIIIKRFILCLSFI